jgi:hypothetical protein
MHIELLWRSRSRSFRNRGIGVGVGSFKNRGVGVGAFVYRLHSPVGNSLPKSVQAFLVLHLYLHAHKARSWKFANTMLKLIISSIYIWDSCYSMEISGHSDWEIIHARNLITCSTENLENLGCSVKDKLLVSWSCQFCQRLASIHGVLPFILMRLQRASTEELVKIGCSTRQGAQTSSVIPWKSDW